jgi:hypothetical protein
MNGDEIRDYIPLVGTSTLVEFTPNNGEDWIKMRVIGINLYNESLLLIEEYHGDDFFHSQWYPLYFQLNRHNPKHYKIRFIK